MKETNKGKPYFHPCVSQGGRVIKQRWKVFIESWNNERDKRRERERERENVTNLHRALGALREQETATNS